MGRAVIDLDPVLFELDYACAEGCPSGRTCCVGMAVEVSAGETRRIDAALPEIAVFQPALIDGQAYVDYLTDEEHGPTIEYADESGRCSFLYECSGKALCAIHSAALSGSTAVARLKPRACRHWPLVLERTPGANSGKSGKSIRS